MLLVAVYLALVQADKGDMLSLTISSVMPSTMCYLAVRVTWGGVVGQLAPPIYSDCTIVNVPRNPGSIPENFIG